MKPCTSTTAVLLPWLLATLMTACSSTPTHLFTLYAVPPVPSAPGSGIGAGAPVRVDAVHFPPALDRIEVVSNLGQGQLNISDVNHWSAPLGQEARQALSADLMARLPGRLIFPHLAKPDGALGITVDILEFKADGTGAWLQASWVIGPTDTARPDMVLLRTQCPVDGAAGTAQALSELLGLLADRIAAGLAAPIPP